MEIGAISLNNPAIGLPVSPAAVAAAANIAATESVTATAAATAATAASTTSEVNAASQHSALLQALQQTLVQYNLTQASASAALNEQTALSNQQAATDAAQTAAANQATIAAATTASAATASLASLLGANPTSTTSSSSIAAATPALASTTANGAGATVASTQLTPLEAQAVVALAGALFQAVTPPANNPAALPNEAAPITAVGGIQTAIGSDGGTAAFQGGYDDTGSHLAALAQQAGASNGARSPSDALAALQANYQSLLASASGPASSVAAYASAPSLQSFLQTLAQNFTPGFSASPGTNAVGNLLETSV